MRRYESKENVYEYVMSRRKRISSEVPEQVKKKVCVEKMGKDNRLFYHVYNKEKSSDRKIFYVYDSSYCYPMKKDEWNFIADMVDYIGVEFFVPIYPLTPEHTCRETFEVLVDVYKEVTTQYTPKQLILAGCGTGAGVALSMNMIAWQEGLKNPDKTLLLSPVLDAEYKDEKLMSKMSEKAKRDSRTVISPGVIDFIVDYWVKDYAGKYEYTSPIHENMNALSGTYIIVSSTDDVFNNHARTLCTGLDEAGIKPFYFEYTGVGTDFFFKRNNDQSVHLRKIIKDMLTDSRDTIINEYMFEVKTRGELSKKFPEIFNDETATRYLAKNRIWYKKYKKKPLFRYLIDAAVYHDFDEVVRTFLKEYPDGTVVYVGCGLDTMFERVDNGRVMWYNLDSPGRIAIRNMYTSENDREKIIDISVHDLSWFNEVKCERDRGLLFVCRNVLEYYTETEVKDFLTKLSDEFKGCNVVFEVDTFFEMLAANRYSGRRGAEYRHRQLYMNDPNSTIESWDPGYRVISAKPVLDGVQQMPGWDSKLKLIYRIAKRLQGTRIVRVRLGYEKFSALFNN